MSCRCDSRTVRLARSSTPLALVAGMRGNKSVHLHTKLNKIQSETCNDHKIHGKLVSSQVIVSSYLPYGYHQLSSIWSWHRTLASVMQEPPVELKVSGKNDITCCLYDANHMGIEGTSLTSALKISQIKRNSFVNACRRLPRVSVTDSTLVSQSRAARAKSAGVWPRAMRVANGISEDTRSWNDSPCAFLKDTSTAWMDCKSAPVSFRPTPLRKNSIAGAMLTLVPDTTDAS